MMLGNTVEYRVSVGPYDLVPGSIFYVSFGLIIIGNKC